MQRFNIVVAALEGEQQAGDEHGAVDGQAALAEGTLMAEEKVRVGRYLAAGEVVDVEDGCSEGMEAKELEHGHEQGDSQPDAKAAVDDQEPVMLDAMPDEAYIAHGPMQALGLLTGYAGCVQESLLPQSMEPQRSACAAVLIRLRLCRDLAQRTTEVALVNAALEQCRLVDDDHRDAVAIAREEIAVGANIVLDQVIGDGCRDIFKDRAGFIAQAAAGPGVELDRIMLLCLQPGIASCL